MPLRNWGLTQDLVVQEDQLDLNLALHGIAHAHPTMPVSLLVIVLAFRTLFGSSHAECRVPHPEAQSPLSRLHTLEEPLTDSLQLVIHLSQRLDLVREG